MKRASKFLIAGLLLLLLGTHAGSRAVADNQEVPPPLECKTTHTIVVVGENDPYHVYPQKVTALNGECLRFENQTNLHAQVQVPKRTFLGADCVTVEVPAHRAAIVLVASYLEAKGEFPYQVYLGGLPPWDLIEPAQREEWKKKGTVAPQSFYAIADSPPHIIIQ